MLKPLLVAVGLLAATTTLAEEVKSIFPGADPSAFAVRGQTWIYPTGSGDRLISWSSPDEKTWTRHGTLITQRDIGWIKDDGAAAHFLWAPDMVAANGRYYLYYAVGPQDPTPSRLGVAVCAHPDGPCTDSGRPLFTGGRGFEAIDPDVFVDSKSGKRYLYAGGSAGATLRVWELAPDMVTIEREVPVDQPPGFTEGAFMHERNGIYYLSYSHGHWNRADYSVHYAMAPTPIGPWTYRGPILQGDGKYKGPGHHAFFQDPHDGSWLIAYARWEGEHDDGPYRDDRHVAVQHVAYDAAGRIKPITMSD